MSTEPAAPTSIDRASQRRVLDRLARVGTAPWLNQEVARRMSERLPMIRQAPHTWIDWWGHLGGGAAAVGAAWPQAVREVVEPTEALLEASRAQMRRPWWALGARAAAQRHLHLESQALEIRAQMVWSNMMLHACLDMDAAFTRWHAVLDVGGFLMFSTFGPDTLRELRQIYAEAQWPPPHPPYVDMHDIGDRLVACGFVDPVMDQEQIRLSWTSPQALLAELRAMGGHLGVSRAAGLRTPRWRDQLQRALAARADDEGRIHMTFEIVYGHAVKPPPRPAAGEPTTVSVDAMRAMLRGRRRSGDA